MARDINVVEYPTHNPGICIRCGVGKGDRPYFVDMGIDSQMVIENKETRLPHYTDGVIYLCNECIISVFRDLNDKIFKYIAATAKANEVENLSSDQTRKILEDEIRMLRKKHDELRANHIELQQQYSAEFVKQVHENDPQKPREDKTADDIIGKLLGEEDHSGESESGGTSGSEISEGRSDGESELSDRLDSTPSESDQRNESNDSLIKRDAIPEPDVISLAL